MLAVESTQPFPSMCMAVTTSQAHFQSNNYPTKKALTHKHVLFSSHIFKIQILHHFVSLVVCCKPNVPSQVQEWDTMELKFFLPVRLWCKTANTFAKGTLLCVTYCSLLYNSQLYANSKYCVFCFMQHIHAGTNIRYKYSTTYNINVHREIIYRLLANTGWMSTMHRDMVIHFAPSSVIVANGESVLQLLGREYKKSWPPPHPCKGGPFTASLAASKL